VTHQQRVCSPRRFLCLPVFGPQRPRLYPRGNGVGTPNPTKGSPTFWDLLTPRKGLFPCGPGPWVFPLKTGPGPRAPLAILWGNKGESNGIRRPLGTSWPPHKHREPVNITPLGEILKTWESFPQRVALGKFPGQLLGPWPPPGPPRNISSNAPWPPKEICAKPGVGPPGKFPNARVP